MESGNAQLAFLLRTGPGRKGWLTAWDVGVLSIKVVMETFRMKGFPPLPELQEYGEERRTQGQGLSPGKYAHPEGGLKKGSGEV